MYTLKQFDADLASSTRKDWCAQAKLHPGEVMVSSYERLLDWVDDITIAGDNGNGDTYAYGLVNDKKTNSACAILELSHARPNSDAPWLKVLSIHIEPRLEVNANEGGVNKDLALVVSHAISESLDLTFNHYPSTQLKIYARTPLTIEFLGSVAYFIELNSGMNIEVTAHGNWLVINKIK